MPMQHPTRAAQAAANLNSRRSPPLLIDNLPRPLPGVACHNALCKAHADRQPPAVHTICTLSHTPYHTPDTPDRQSAQEHIHAQTRALRQSTRMQGNEPCIEGNSSTNSANTPLLCEGNSSTTTVPRQQQYYWRQYTAPTQALRHVQETFSALRE